MQFLTTLAALAVAFVLGGVIGFERQWRQRNAGLRTNVLVAVGAAAFSDLGLRLMGAEGATRIIAYVVSGIGFLGAGVILKDGANIRGLNTAATLWCSAAVGAFSGSGMPAEATALACFVLAGNTLLRPAVNWINRRPIDSVMTEAEYRVHVVCCQEHVSAVRDLLDAELDRASYPIREVETLSRSDEQVELAAILVPSSAEEGELDTVVAALERSPHVRSATWSVETTA
jgi:putative Mg2+ transporter-C (MgtC) family protein